MSVDKTYYQVVKFLLLTLITIITGCAASACDEKLDTCEGRGGFTGVWSEDDQILGVAVKHFGDTLGASDNQTFLFTLDADGSNLQQHKELHKNQELLHVNNSHQYAILRRITRTQYIDWPSQYSMLDLVTNEETVLKDLQENCYSYRAIPSLSGDYLAVVEAFSQSTGNSSLQNDSKELISQTEKQPRKVTRIPLQEIISSSQTGSATCNPLALKITMLDATNMQVLSETQSNVADFSYHYFSSGTIEEKVVLFWTDLGLMVRNFAPSVSEYAMIDVTGNVFATTTDLNGCDIPVTSSSHISSNGMVAEVFAFLGLDYAEIGLKAYENSDGVPLCQ